MTRIDFEVVIARPIDDVFAVLTDPERTPSWSESAVEERWATPPPHGVGSRRVAVTRPLGRTTENEAEVTAFEPGRAWTLRSVRGPAFEASARFGQVPGGTRVEWTWTFGGASGALMRLFAPVFRRRFETDLEVLKRMMERGDLWTPQRDGEARQGVWPRPTSGRRRCAVGEGPRSLPPSL